MDTSGIFYGFILLAAFVAAFYFGYKDYNDSKSRKDNKRLSISERDDADMRYRRGIAIMFATVLVFIFLIKFLLSIDSES